MNDWKDEVHFTASFLHRDGKIIAEVRRSFVERCTAKIYLGSHESMNRYLPWLDTEKDLDGRRAKQAVNQLLDLGCLDLVPTFPPLCPERPEYRTVELHDRSGNYLGKIGWDMECRGYSMGRSMGRYTLTLPDGVTMVRDEFDLELIRVVLWIRNGGQHDIARQDV